MCSKLTGIEFLEEYRKNRNKYYPISERVWCPNTGEGFNCGEIFPGTPYFCDCWMYCGATQMDIYVPQSAVKEMTGEELIHLFESKGIFKLREGYPYSLKIRGIETLRKKVPQINFDIIIGDEERVYADGAKIYPYALLNRYLEEHPYEDTDLSPEGIQR